MCSILAGEFDEPDEVFMSFIVSLPDWARLEFEYVGKNLRGIEEETCAPARCRAGVSVQVYDERLSLEIDYRRLWRFNGVRIGADAEDEAWCAQAIAVVAMVLGNRKERPLRIDCLVYIEEMIWPDFQAFSGLSLVYLCNMVRVGVELLWAGASVACGGFKNSQEGRIAKLFRYRNNAFERVLWKPMIGRVLKEGGRLVVLEFGHPQGPFGLLYAFYFRALLPVVGRLVSAHRSAYNYLPNTVYEFPEAEQLSAMMRDAGFREVSHRPMTGGIAELHTGVRE